MLTGQCQREAIFATALERTPTTDAGQGRADDDGGEVGTCHRLPVHEVRGATLCLGLA